MARLGQLENKNAMKDIIAEGDMDGNSMDRILKAIDDMGTRINADTDNKLTNYVETAPTFEDADAEIKSTARRVQFNEGKLKEQGTMIDENIEKEENNRKRIARLEADLNALKNSGPVEEPDQSMATTGMSKLTDADELTKLVKKIEVQLKRTDTTVGGLSEKAEEIETEVEKLKNDKRKSSTAATGPGANCT